MVCQVQKFERLFSSHGLPLPAVTVTPQRAPSILVFPRLSWPSLSNSAGLCDESCTEDFENYRRRSCPSRHEHILDLPGRGGGVQVGPTSPCLVLSQGAFCILLVVGSSSRFDVAGCRCSWMCAGLAAFFAQASVRSAGVMTRRSKFSLVSALLLGLLGLWTFLASDAFAEVWLSLIYLGLEQVGQWTASG